MRAFNEKYEELKRFIEEKGRNGVVIAFSGGVDSSTLAAVCHRILKDKVVAVTARSPLYPPEDLEEARKTAEEIGIKHYIIETNELQNEDFTRNPENRCYYCKKELIEHLHNFAQKIGFKVIFEGTNFSDLKEHRPGFKAIEEKENVFSPWVEAGFTKEEIRLLAKKLGLSNYDKPPKACLASRIPFGEKITEEKLKRIGMAEKFIREICGVQQIRVRDHNGLARIEVGKEERNRLFNPEIMDKIAEKLKQLGFKYVTLDLEGYRSGSMLAMLRNNEKEEH